MQRQKVDWSLPGGGEGEMGRWRFNGDGVAVWQDKKIPEMEGRDGCPTI